MEFKFALMIICVCFMSATSVNAQTDADPSLTTSELTKDFKLSILQVDISRIVPGSDLIITVIGITDNVSGLKKPDDDIFVLITLVGSNISSKFPSLCDNTTPACPIPSLTKFEAIFTLSIPEDTPAGSITRIDITFIRTTTNQVVGSSAIPISA